MGVQWLALSTSPAGVNGCLSFMWPRDELVTYSCRTLLFNDGQLGCSTTASCNQNQKLEKKNEWIKEITRRRIQINTNKYWAVSNPSHSWDTHRQHVKSLRPFSFSPMLIQPRSLLPTSLCSAFLSSISDSHSFCSPLHLLFSPFLRPRFCCVSRLYTRRISPRRQTKLWRHRCVCVCTTTCCSCCSRSKCVGKKILDS